MTPDEISRLAFLLYPHIVKEEPDHGSIESLAARINRLQQGLLPEDEFAAMVSWLGNCAGIHHIDQTPIPMPGRAPADKLRAPDFIAFPIVDGRAFPVLIEVKSHIGDQLDWSEAYLASLRKFAELLRLPLQVAWKAGDLWTLVDHQHFEKKQTAFHLTLGKAIREDLLSVLFRNLRIQMNPEVEFILDADILNEVVGGTDTLLPDGPFHIKIINAGFYRGGIEIYPYDPKYFALVLVAPDEAELRRIGTQRCQQIFRPLADHSFTLSNVLVGQLSLGASVPLNWHHVLTKPFPSSGQEFRNSLQAGIDCGFIRYVMDVVPNTWPAFLPSENKQI